MPDGHIIRLKQVATSHQTADNIDGMYITSLYVCDTTDCIN